jgi:hypothetical protein
MRVTEAGAAHSSRGNQGVGVIVVVVTGVQTETGTRAQNWVRKGC